LTNNGFFLLIKAKCKFICLPLNLITKKTYFLMIVNSIQIPILNNDLNDSVSEAQVVADSAVPAAAVVARGAAAETTETPETCEVLERARTSVAHAAGAAGTSGVTKKTTPVVETEEGTRADLQETEIAECVTIYLVFYAIKFEGCSSWVNNARNHDARQQL
jgi:hypothetical protein